MKQRRGIVTTKIANRAVEPLVRYRQKADRFLTDLTERLSTRAGQPISIQHVMKWLHPDPQKRQQPRLGAGLLLLEVGKQLIAEHEKKASN